MLEPRVKWLEGNILPSPLVLFNRFGNFNTNTSFSLKKKKKGVQIYVCMCVCTCVRVYNMHIGKCVLGTMSPASREVINKKSFACMASSSFKSSLTTSFTRVTPANGCIIT